MITAERRAKAEEILRTFPQRSSALIPLLHLWQEEEGYISEEGMREIAELMEVPPAYVQAVVSFYTLFRREPKGRYQIQVCTNLSCLLNGAEEVVRALLDHLHVELGETTPDGLFTVEEVECLAACDGAPCLQVNLEYKERMTPEAAVALVEELRREASARGGENGHA